MVTAVAAAVSTTHNLISNFSTLTTSPIPKYKKKTATIRAWTTTTTTTCSISSLNIYAAVITNSTNIISAYSKTFTLIS